MAELSVTIKGEGQNAPWIVVRGESHQDVRAMIVGAFEIPDQPHYSLSDMANEASAVLRGTSVLSKTLGAKPVTEEVAQETNAAGSKPAWQGESAWDRVAQERDAQQQSSGKSVADLIEGATTVEEMKGIWSDHSADIKSQDLVETWTTKAKALKAAATN